MPIKGHIVLADAFSVVATRYPQTKLILIGNTNGTPASMEIKSHVEGFLAHLMAAGRVWIIEN